ncbi:MAG: Polyketide cyclase / dehydrase and lipid transport [Thermoplasmata archaeon]|jgi:uncharacterized protein YndB with AHSA1/START domain|nr:Polyketide cyclase / dehydrase and lipid transport [Thermoplasmata archaeon]
MGIDVTDSVTIDAPRQTVWAALADPGAWGAWNPFVNRVAGTHALDATRTVTGVYGKAEGTSVERCVAYEAGRSIKWLAESDSNGFSGRMATDVTAEFTLADAGAGKTTATARTAFVPQRLFLKLMAPALRGQVAKANRSRLGGLKLYLETGQVAPKGK